MLRKWRLKQKNDFLIKKKHVVAGLFVWLSPGFVGKYNKYIYIYIYIYKYNKYIYIYICVYIYMYI